MNHRLLWLGLGLTAWLASTTANAEVVTDGTTGPALTLPGPDYAITPDLGRQVGGNSFYSLLSFSLRQGESATFSGPDSIANLIVRVTGGHESMIDGLLRSTVPGADLYLLNPAGVIFGPHASLDLQGAFYVSTASSLSLGEVGVFDATAPEASVLTADPPTSFGFLGEEASAINCNGASLAVPSGETISIVGGRIEMINGSSLTADEVAIMDPEIVVGEDSSINSATVEVSSEVEPWGDEESDPDGAPLPAEEETTLYDDTPQPAEEISAIAEEDGDVEFARRGTALHLHETGPAWTPPVVKGTSKITIDGSVREGGSYRKDNTTGPDDNDRNATGYDSRIQLGVNAKVNDEETGHLSLETGVPTVPASTPGPQATLDPPGISFLPPEPKPLRPDPFPFAPVVEPVSTPIAIIDLEAALLARQPQPLPLPETTPFAPLLPEPGLAVDAPVAFGF